MINHILYTLTAQFKKEELFSFVNVLSRNSIALLELFCYFILLVTLLLFYSKIDGFESFSQ